MNLLEYDVCLCRLICCHNSESLMMNDLMLHFWIGMWLHYDDTFVCYCLNMAPLAPCPQSTLMYITKGPPTHLHKYIPIPIGRQEQSGCIRKVIPNRKVNIPKSFCLYAFMLNSWLSNAHWQVHTDTLYLHSLSVGVQLSWTW